MVLNYRTGAKRPISNDDAHNAVEIARFAPVLMSDTVQLVVSVPPDKLKCVGHNDRDHAVVHSRCANNF